MLLKELSVLLKREQEASYMTYRGNYLFALPNGSCTILACASTHYLELVLVIWLVPESYFGELNWIILKIHVYVLEIIAKHIEK